MSDEQQSKIVYFIRVPLETVLAPNAALVKWFQNIATHPTCMLVQKTIGNRADFKPQVIMKKLRDTFGPNNVAFSVPSEKPDRMLICARSSRETTKLEKEPSANGSESISRCPV